MSFLQVVSNARHDGFNHLAQLILYGGIYQHQVKMMLNID